MNEIKCEVTKSINVFIKAKNSTVDLNEPLYAVNWFSTKIAWMYHLYNFLANKSLTKIGGSAFFKGEIIKTILDQKNTKRDFILIIRYPNGNGFKGLMENTYFKIVSLLRMFAVKEFSFGFTNKQLVSDSNLIDNLYYVVHHFKSTSHAVYSQINDLLTDNVTVKYSGKMVAELYSKQTDKKIEEVPNVMDGVVIYESKSGSAILDMIAQSKYQKIIENLDSSYIGTVKRTI